MGGTRSLTPARRIRRLLALLFGIWCAGLFALAVGASDPSRGARWGGAVLYTVTETIRVWIPYCGLRHPALWFYLEVRPLYGLVAGVFSHALALLGAPPNLSLRWMNVLLSTGALAAVLRAGLAAGLSLPWAGFAALLVASNPLFFLLSVSGHTTTLATLLFALALALDRRGRFGAAGLCIGLASQVRPEVSLWAAAWVVESIRRREFRAALFTLLPAAAASAATLALFGWVPPRDLGYLWLRVRGGRISGAWPGGEMTAALLRSHVRLALASVGYGTLGVALAGALRGGARPAGDAPPAVARGIPWYWTLPMGLLLPSLALPYLLDVFVPARGRYLVPTLPLLALWSARFLHRLAAGSPLRRSLAVALALSIVLEGVGRWASGGLPDQLDANAWLDPHLRPYRREDGRWISDYVRDHPASGTWLTYDAYPVLLDDPDCALARGTFWYGPMLYFDPAGERPFAYADLARHRVADRWPREDLWLLTSGIYVKDPRAVPADEHWAVVRSFDEPITLYRLRGTESRSP